jgi:YjbE family integral membrane protein
MELLAEVQSPAFWHGLLIIWVNIILSGDNAVVIALAARSLPLEQQKKAVMWGAGAAVVLRIVLTIVAVKLLTLPYLKIIGGLLLFWIAIGLLVPEDGGEDVDSSDNLFQAIKTILIADLVMSLDNVIAVAGVAKGSMLLLVLGLAISIPLVIFGATMLMKLMERFPVIITAGAGILGIKENMAWMHLHTPIGDVSWAQILGVIVVIVVGKMLAARKGKTAHEATG